MSKRKAIKAGKEDYDSNRTFPVIAILFCGLFILSAGLYFVLAHRLLHGHTLPNSRFGSSTGGAPISLNGYGLILIGIALCVYPASVPMKRAFKKKLHRS